MLQGQDQWVLTLEGFLAATFSSKEPKSLEPQDLLIFIQNCAV